MIAGHPIKFFLAVVVMAVAAILGFVHTLDLYQALVVFALGLFSL